MVAAGVVARVRLAPRCVATVEVHVRVLVVSESPVERLRAVSALALHAGDRDIDVVEADGAEALRQRVLHDGERFDVLVVDGDLQPRGGYATLYDLRSRGDQTGTPAVPSLVLASRDQDVWLAQWAGANDLLLKPVDPFELARRVVALEGATIPDYGGSTNTAQQVATALRSAP